MFINLPVFSSTKDRAYFFAGAQDFYEAHPDLGLPCKHGTVSTMKAIWSDHHIACLSKYSATSISQEHLLEWLQRHQKEAAVKGRDYLQSLLDFDEVVAGLEKNRVSSSLLSTVIGRITDVHRRWYADYQKTLEMLQIEGEPRKSEKESLFLGLKQGWLFDWEGKLHLATPFGVMQKKVAINSVVEIDQKLKKMFGENLGGTKVQQRMRGIDREWRVIAEKAVGAKLAKELQAAKEELKESSLPSYPLRVEVPPIAAQTGTLQLGDYLIDFALSSGRKSYMEDAVLVDSLRGEEASILGVFDGHGGAEASQFLKEKIGPYLSKEIQSLNERYNEGEIFNLLKLAFVHLNEQFEGQAGSTALLALFMHGKLWVANVGDGRAVSVTNREVTQLSRDQSPSVPDFKRSIEERGGQVTPDGCLNGILGCARSIGDKDVGFGRSARSKITCTEAPDVLVMACDGVWSHVNSMEAAQLASYHEEAAAQIILNHAHFKGSEDNLSAIVCRRATKQSSS